MHEEEILKRLQECPETYRSILGENYGRNTGTIIIRRKLLRNIYRGLVGRVQLNGTRGGEVLFYNTNKKYEIVVCSEHRDFKYYVCKSVKHIDKVTLLLIAVKELCNCKWVDYNGDLKIFIGTVVKIL